MARKRWMGRETISLDPVRIGSAVVTPEVRLSRLLLPGVAFVRYRPAAVLVRSERGVERIPIRDVTRLLRIGVTAAVFAIALIAAIVVRQQEEETS